MKLGEKCDNCGLKVTKDLKTDRGGYADPCMGILPGVKFACCGHGTKGGYIFFENGVTVRFPELTDVEQRKMSKYHVFNEDTDPDLKELF